MAALTSEDRTLMGSVLGTYADSMIALLREDGPAIGRTGRLIDQAQNLFFKLNLMQGWANRQRSALGAAMQATHAQWADRSFDALPEGTRSIFANHRISPAMWDAIRQGTVKIGDHTIVASEGIRALPDSAFTKIADENGWNVNFARDETADRYLRMALDRVNVGSNTPDWRVRQFWIGDAQAGTYWGEFFNRNIAVLKGFPTGFIENTIGRMVYGYGATHINASMITGQTGRAFAQTFLLATALGYLSMTARDLVTGKEPRDPTDYRTIRDSMLRGGAMGIYGDIIFGNVEKKHGRNMITEMLGPGAGQVNDVYDLLARWTKISQRQSDESNLAATFRFATRQVPGLGLPGVKTAFDYLIYHEVMENLSPGYMARAQRNLEKQTGQHFWMMPGR